MNARLRIAAPAWERLNHYHLAPGKRVERLSYVWARAYRDKQKTTTVVVPHNAPMFLFADDCYACQSGRRVTLLPEVLNGMLVEFAASDFNVLLNIHDHWFEETTTFSAVDDWDDVCFDKYLRERFEPMLTKQPHIGPVRSILNIAIVLARRGCDARLVDSRNKEVFTSLSSLDVIGSRFERVLKNSEGTFCSGQPSELFSRQGDFIRQQHQALISGLSVALIGCGGLNSIVSESLARTGFGSGDGALLLIDDDVMEASNLNRWQGGMLSMVGKPKAEVLERRLKRMFPWLRAQAFARSIYHPEAERAICSANIIVSGLDNDAGRYWLNRVALQYCMPYFDAGVAVSGMHEETDFLIRYYAVLPGVTACVECTQYTLINRPAAIHAFTDPATLAAQRAAGYVIDDTSVAAPSVYALNLRAAGLLTTELLNFVCGYRPTATMISESWRNGTFQRSDRENFPEEPDPACPICGFYAGAADSESLPRPAALQEDSKLVSCVDWLSKRSQEEVDQWQDVIKS